MEGNFNGGPIRVPPPLTPPHKGEGNHFDWNGPAARGDMEGD